MDIMDFALCHIKTVRDGERDDMDHSNHVCVIFDQKTDRYDVPDWPAAAPAFELFVACAWDSDDVTRDERWVSA